MTPEIKQQIEQEAASQTGFSEDKDCTPISKGNYYGYIYGATKYAARAITAEQEAERLREALEEIKKGLNWIDNSRERNIIIEALTPNP